MLSAGWHAHKLNAPGKFLISAAEHDSPRRARAYLVTDDAVRDAAGRNAGIRPDLDETSRRAITSRSGPATPAADARDAPGTPQMPPGGLVPPPGKGNQAGDGQAPEATLRAELSDAPEEGVSAAYLMEVTGMSRRWVYYRLSEYARLGTAVQTSRGNWRATRQGGDAR